MPDEQNEEWRELTFSQRADKAPLPEALQAGKLTTRFRNLTWLAYEKDIGRCTYGFESEYFRDDAKYWTECFWAYYFDILNVPHDEIPLMIPEEMRQQLRNIIIKRESHEVLTLVEFCLRFEGMSEELALNIEECFQSAPYCIDRSSEPVCIIPTTSEEMEESVKRSLTNINKSELKGAKSHFRNSSQELNNGNYAASVRESINAVASAARKIDPDAAKDLGPALDSLERSEIIKHRALKAAFQKLYGYTSDAQGIRKPLIENEAADVGFDEAIFMYGACVSFVDYLVSKQRQLKE